MNHRVGSIVVGITVGLLVALWSYQWITDSGKRAEHAEQERVVTISRTVLGDKLAIGEIELVDPLSPQRKVGKVYIYPLENGWELSGYYRRDHNDRWHPYLLTLSADMSLLSLKVQDTDSGLVQLATVDPTFEVIP